ncbi:hypothetical protein [Saccharicrinis sp. GN24d3]|uniref:hypothetical protein n=1 Tax=Saccharicrinis sp. GN24d3 TaxID=3458416 RepID=UPI0040364848
MAISNDRIISINNTHVKFRAKDYRKKDLPSPKSCKAMNFYSALANMSCPRDLFALESMA